MHRLLILACSKRKLVHPNLLPALERYDGGSFRVIRRAKRKGYLPAHLDILIISAQYGLISGETPIAYYERAMDSARMKVLQPEITKALQPFWRNPSLEVFIDLGSSYSRVIEDLTLLEDRPTIEIARGRIGERLAQLKHWLLNKAKEDSTYSESSGE